MTFTAEDRAQTEARWERERAIESSIAVAHVEIDGEEAVEYPVAVERQGNEYVFNLPAELTARAGKWCTVRVWLEFCDQ